MIKQETITIGEKQFIRTYSDNGMMIHGGMPEADYSEAIDPAELGRTYTETDTPIDGDSTAEEVVNILTGVSE
ncbi:MAG: hypothetical protein IKD75_01625 [Prevotella sp.]|nr:hypothetical protein [Prevotella sp.]